jgi:hypothetical protein
MSTVPHLDPQGVYDDGFLVLDLGLSTAAITKARRSGSLRYTRKGKRTLYLGQWLLNWLAEDSQPGELVKKDDTGNASSPGE